MTNKMVTFNQRRNMWPFKSDQQPTFLFQITIRAVRESFTYMTRRQHAALRKFYIFNNHGPVLTGAAVKIATFTL